MSLLKSKSYLNGVLLTIFLTLTSTAMAFTPVDGRLWKPYQPETFGGQRRSGNGFYFDIDAILWRIDSPENVGLVLDEMKLAGIAEDLFADNLPTDFTLGTRITVGNRQGHHGWRLNAYHISGLGGGVNHSDPVDFSIQGMYSREFIHTYDEDGNYLYDGYYRFNTDYLDIRAERVLSYSSKTSIAEFDLAWTYRPHPFKWGELEFSAGIKYRDVTDKLLFTDKANSYYYESFTWDVGRKYAGDSRLYDNVWGPLLVAPDELRDGKETDDEDLLPSITVSTLHVSRSASNRMVGPSFGLELTRRNARWTFGFAPTVFLGVNNQSFTYSESYTDKAQLASSSNNNNSSSSNSNNNDRNTPDWGNLTLDNLAAIRNIFRNGDGSANIEESTRQTYFHRQHRTVFSPGASLQLSAKWQWTDALGLKLAFDGTFMDNVARGTDLIATPRYIKTSDGATKRDGYDYSLRTKGGPVFVYGVSFGLEIKR